jgi:hypothetical protein
LDSEYIKINVDEHQDIEGGYNNESNGFEMGDPMKPKSAISWFLKSIKIIVDALRNAMSDYDSDQQHYKRERCLWIFHPEHGLVKATETIEGLRRRSRSPVSFMATGLLFLFLAGIAYLEISAAIQSL